MSESFDFSDNIWIGDSGASCHYCNSDEGLFDTKVISDKITVANGKKMQGIKIGKLRCDVKQRDGISFQITPQEVKFVPELWINLFSINKALKNGFQIGSDGIIIQLTKETTRLAFDQVVNKKNGFVSGVQLLPLRIQTASNVMDKSETKLEISKLQQTLRHCG